MKKNIEIGIAEDHTLVRQGLVSMLKTYDKLNVMFDVENGKELLTRLKRSKPDIVLLDIEMPLVSGGEALEKIQARYPNIRVIMISMFYDEAIILEFIRKGAKAFLPKNASIDRVVEAIFSVHEKGCYFDATVSALMAKKISDPTNAPDKKNGTSNGFTKRQVDIIKMICQNKTNKEIAGNLFISLRTVEGHRLKIMKKTNSKSSTELAKYANQNKLL